jgi:hypothetical protein
VTGSVGGASRPNTSASRTHVPSITSQAFFRPTSSQILQAQRGQHPTSTLSTTSFYHEGQSDSGSNSYIQSSGSNPTIRGAAPLRQEEDDRDHVDSLEAEEARQIEINPGQFDERPEIRAENHTVEAEKERAEARDEASRLKTKEAGAEAKQKKMERTVEGGIEPSLSQRTKVPGPNINQTSTPNQYRYTTQLDKHTGLELALVTCVHDKLRKDGNEQASLLIFRYRTFLDEKD